MWKRYWPGARKSTEKPRIKLKHVLVRNLSYSHVRPVLVPYCSSFFCQLRGLTFRKRIAPEDGLLLVQRRDSRLDAAIHMLFVFTDLAVAWIDGAGVVVDTCLARRWRPFYVPRHPARYVLEMSPDRFEDFHPGDRVSIEQADQD